MKKFLVAVALAAVLAFGVGGRGEDASSVEPAPPVPAAVAHPVPLEVPLSITETTPPPGWHPPPATVEEQLADGVRDLGRDLAWQASLAAVAVLIVLGLMATIERRRGNW